MNVHGAIPRWGIGAVLALALSGCNGVGVPTFPTAMSGPAATNTGAAVAVLATLPVKGRAPMTGYSRSVFMPHGWTDPDHSGCDSRRDVLARQAVADIVRKGAHSCVFTATIADPYTGQTIASTKADVDHRVSLGDAWQTGAQQLDDSRRQALAQDPDNLVAVSSSLNRSKGDGDAASFLPPLKSYRCQYVASQVEVKHRYGLWVTPAEHDAMARVLASCPEQQATS